MARFMAAWLLTFLTLTPAVADTFNINVDNGETVMLLLKIMDMNYATPQEVFNGNISPVRCCPSISMAKMGITVTSNEPPIPPTGRNAERAIRIA
jgi:hypothetical protein